MARQKAPARCTQSPPLPPEASSAPSAFAGREIRRRDDRFSDLYTAADVPSDLRHAWCPKLISFVLDRLELGFRVVTLASNGRRSAGGGRGLRSGLSHEVFECHRTLLGDTQHLVHQISVRRESRHNALQQLDLLVSPAPRTLDQNDACVKLAFSDDRG